MAIVSQLAALRGEHRLTQAEVAKLAGVSRQTINSIETGRFEPSLSLALTLARLFGQPVESLFALEEAAAQKVPQLGPPPLRPPALA